MLQRITYLQLPPVWWSWCPYFYSSYPGVSSGFLHLDSYWSLSGLHLLVGWQSSCDSVGQTTSIIIYKIQNINIYCSFLGGRIWCILKTLRNDCESYRTNVTVKEDERMNGSTCTQALKHNTSCLIRGGLPSNQSKLSF